MGPLLLGILLLLLKWLLAWPYSIELILLIAGIILIIYGAYLLVSSSGTGRRRWW
jgi:hypothetical protein